MTSIQVVNGDAAGEGLNDPALVVPSGGNSATTLGAARLQVLNRVFADVGCHLTGDVPIRVTVNFDPMTCSVNSGILASAGPTTATRNFPGAPLANTFYPVPLANALASVDLNGATPEVFISVNSQVGTPTCIDGASWYHGLDGQSPPLDIDLYTIVMHELTHGLGFLTFQNVSTGAKMFGADDVYMTRLSVAGSSVSYTAMTDAMRAAANRSEPSLAWSGPALIARHGAPAPLFAPATVMDGSSVHHLSGSLLPGELMVPFYRRPIHDLGRALSVLQDEGWQVQTECSPPEPAPATPEWAAAVLAAALFAAAVTMLGRGALRARSRSAAPRV